MMLVGVLMSVCLVFVGSFCRVLWLFLSLSMLGMLFGWWVV